MQSNNTFQVRRNIDGEIIYYGSYPTLIMALMVRDIASFNNWKKPVKEDKLPKNISKTASGKYTITKHINGEKFNFGSYNTLTEAKGMKQYFESKGWKNCIHERLQYSTVENIIFNRGKYIIRKRINGKDIDFGRFDNYDEACKERDLLKKCNWDIDALCESIKEDVEGVIWLNQNMHNY